jgi:hypothetical protein
VVVYVGVVVLGETRRGKAEFTWDRQRAYLEHERKKQAGRKQGSEDHALNLGKRTHGKDVFTRLQRLHGCWS